MSTDKAPAPPAEAPHYNPVADVFAALLAADRPLDIHQIRKLLPKMPDGTISGSLSKLRSIKAIDRTEGQRPSMWRALMRALPRELQGPGRLRAPATPGQHRVRRPAGGKSADVLLTLPVGRRDSMTVSEKDARALYVALGRLFGEKR